MALQAQEFGPGQRRWYARFVTPARVLAELESLAARLGVAVRVEGFGEGLDGQGGLCWLRGKPLVVMNTALPVAERIATLAKALAGFDLDAVYMRPLLRARVTLRTDGGAPSSRVPELGRRRDRRRSCA
jgi:hypothetical protein